MNIWKSYGYQKICNQTNRYQRWGNQAFKLPAFRSSNNSSSPLRFFCSNSFNKFNSRSGPQNKIFTLRNGVVSRFNGARAHIFVWTRACTCILPTWGESQLGFRVLANRPVRDAHRQPWLAPCRPALKATVVLHRLSKHWDSQWVTRAPQWLVRRFQDWQGDFNFSASSLNQLLCLSKLLVSRFIFRSISNYLDSWSYDPSFLRVF